MQCSARLSMTHPACASRGCAGPDEMCQLTHSDFAPAIVVGQDRMNFTRGQITRRAADSNCCSPTRLATPKRDGVCAPHAVVRHSIPRTIDKADKRQPSALEQMSGKHLTTALEVQVNRMTATGRLRPTASGGIRPSRDIPLALSNDRSSAHCRRRICVGIGLSRSVTRRISGDVARNVRLPIFVLVLAAVGARCCTHGRSPAWGCL